MAKGIKIFSSLYDNVFPKFITRSVSRLNPQPYFEGAFGLWTHLAGLFGERIFHQLDHQLLYITFDHLLFTVRDSAYEIIAFCDEPVLHVNASLIPVNDLRGDLIQTKKFDESSISYRGAPLVNLTTLFSYPVP